MAIQEICTLFLESTCFGIEIEEVQEVIRQPPLTRIPLASPDICGLVNLRGQVIPVVDLPCRLGMRSPTCGINNGEQFGYNIIVNTGDGAVGFLVDEVGDVLSCAMENLEPPPANLPPYIRSCLKGTYKLDRDLLLVLNIAKIVAMPYAPCPMPELELYH